MPQRPNRLGVELRVVSEINFSAHQLGLPRAVVRDDLDMNPWYVRRAAPVCRIASS